MANQKSVRYSVSISYLTNIAVQNVNKVRTCAHEWTSSLIIRKLNELNHRDRAQININSDKNIIQ
jgi:hypothetical protein